MQHQGYPSSRTDVGRRRGAVRVDFVRFGGMAASRPRIIVADSSVGDVNRFLLWQPGLVCQSQSGPVIPIAAWIGNAYRSLAGNTYRGLGRPLR